MKFSIQSPGQPCGASLLVFIADEKKHYFTDASCPLPAELARFSKRLIAGQPDSEMAVSLPGENGNLAVLFCSPSLIKHFPLNEKIKTIAAHALSVARKRGASNVAFILDTAPGSTISGQIAEGCLLSGYRFDKYKSKKTASDASCDITFVVDKKHAKEVQASISHAELVCASVNFARDLINEPPAELYPAVLADVAKSLAKRNALDCGIWDKPALKKNGCNGILSVGRGSANRPRLITIRYKPKTHSPMHLAIVGKAVTFDSGGYSIKPAKDMWEMKGDMSGGAAALAAIEAIARLKLNIRVTAIVPSVENRIDNNAYLPGDVIRAKNGKTVHVDNTDAEGRLILMDALVRAKEEGATHIVDLATLTGAVVRALGTSISGILGNDQKLVNSVISAGREIGEDIWQLPLYDEYRDMLRSDIADMDNSGRSTNAGAITAALFLREFVDPSIKWAHLDIAGTFLITKKWKYFSPGATGVGVRTLVSLAQSFASTPRAKTNTN